ncbi:hypothetical protein IAT38_008232 [Cryptococcus sp. DSM 104549]
MSHPDLKPAPPMYTPRPPPGIRRRLWDWSMWFQSTFALSMMQPWEKAVILSTLSIVTLLFWISVYTYLPNHLAYLSRRFAYYVYGDETAEVDLLGPVGEWVEEGWVKGVVEVRKGLGMVGGGRVEL